VSEAVGAIEGLWRFPVKSMPGEKLDAVDVTEDGLLGDRAYGVIDTDTGKALSAKNPKVAPLLFACRPAFEERPQLGGDLPPVRITLPDATVVRSDSSNVDDELSRYFSRHVTLARVAPDDFTIEQYHPDVENLDPEGHRDTVVEQKLGAALLAEAGLPPFVPGGSFFDMFPVSVMTTSTLERLGELRPESKFDERRFRMNVIVNTRQGGFVENDWIGRAVAIGDDVQLTVTIPDPRCVMTTLAQEDLPKDTEVLRTLTRHNRIDVGGSALYPCAGVYAIVGAPGTIRKGDLVELN
jgi:uncharacterized protein YcbX